MKILIVAPLKRKIGPKITAARPRMIFDLVSGLIKQGQQVSILGTADSQIKGAKIIPVMAKGLMDLPVFENEFYGHNAFLTKQAMLLEKVANQFDIIHNHCYPEFFPLLRADKIKVPILTTIHAQLIPELDEALALFNKQSYFVAISQSAKKLAKKTKISQVIYNGVDTNLYKFKKEKGDYLLWLGRLAKAKDKQGNFLDAKGVRWAIKLAEATGQKLIISGNVEDRTFFDKDVLPHLSEKIKWVGQISKEQPLTKQQVVQLMQNARAFLMTINWREPFGLVMAEAMACGTPIIAFNRGSVPELVKNYKTGFIVPPKQGLAGLKKALSRIDQIKPENCRDWVEQNFSLEKMVDNYLKAYQSITKTS